MRSLLIREEVVRGPANVGRAQVQEVVRGVAHARDAVAIKVPPHTLLEGVVVRPREASGSSKGLAMGPDGRLNVHLDPVDAAAGQVGVHVPVEARHLVRGHDAHAVDGQGVVPQGRLCGNDGRLEPPFGDCWRVLAKAGGLVAEPAPVARHGVPAEDFADVEARPDRRHDAFEAPSLIFDKAGCQRVPSVETREFDVRVDRAQPVAKVSRGREQAQRRVEPRRVLADEILQSRWDPLHHFVREKSCGSRGERDSPADCLPPVVNDEELRDDAALLERLEAPHDPTGRDFVVEGVPGAPPEQVGRLGNGLVVPGSKSGARVRGVRDDASNRLERVGRDGEAQGRVPAVQLALAASRVHGQPQVVVAPAVAGRTWLCG
mmetsp:Transcript_31250/g.67332  ORF Transcript_31250/g.67332 Transcript_31250/m.67332 type:complete len:376 (+) Transcript_31250:1158-2285(+)